MHLISESESIFLIIKDRVLTDWFQIKVFTGGSVRDRERENGLAFLNAEPSFIIQLWITSFSCQKCLISNIFQTFALFVQPRWRLLPSLSHNDCHCNDLFINSTWDAFLGRNSLSDTSLPATSLRGKRVKSSTGLFKYSLTAYCWILCKICAVEFFSSPVGNKIFSQSDSGLLSVSQGWFSPLWWLTGWVNKARNRPQSLFGSLQCFFCAPTPICEREMAAQVNCEGGGCEKQTLEKLMGVCWRGKLDFPPRQAPPSTSHLRLLEAGDDSIKWGILARVPGMLGVSALASSVSFA